MKKPKCCAWGIKTKRGALVNQAFSCRSDAEQLCDKELGDRIVRVLIREAVPAAGRPAKATGPWRWADGVGHYFLPHHPWSSCMKEHRMYAQKPTGKGKCEICKKAAKSSETEAR